MQEKNFGSQLCAEHIFVQFIIQKKKIEWINTFN